jgi:CheY-like chemotaxis protein
MYRVVIADDEKDITEIVADALSGRGFECHPVYRGDDAFETAKEVKPDLLILDIFMPGKNGYELCRDVRRHSMLYPVPILLLSAIGSEPEILYGLAQGADDYIPKPFDINELALRARKLAERYVRSREAGTEGRVPGRDMTLKRITNKLARGDDFALCYAEVMGLGIASRRYGAELCSAIVNLARKSLSQCVTELGIYESFIGHLGGGHFVCLVDTDKYGLYCKRVTGQFAESLQKLRPLLAQPLQTALPEAGNHQSALGLPLVQMRIGVTTNRKRGFKTALEMLRVSDEVKRKPLHSPREAPIFVDERY